MASRRQKPVDQLQDQRRQRTKSAPKVDGSELRDDPDAFILPAEGDERALAEMPLMVGLPVADIPKCPAGLQKHIAEKWEVFWRSPLAQFVLSVDRVTVLERYFRTIDINDRAYHRFMRKWYDKGSTGQNVLSPAYQVYRETSRLLDTLENQLGVGSRSRMQLNIQFGEQAESLKDFLAALRTTSAEDEGEWIEVEADVVT